MKINTNTKTKSRYLVIVGTDDDRNLFSSVTGVKEFIEDYAFESGFDATDIEEYFELYEIVRKVDFTVEDRPSVDIDIDS